MPASRSAGCLEGEPDREFHYFDEGILAPSPQLGSRGSFHTCRDQQAFLPG
jgi:hypothetical protein